MPESSPPSVDVLVLGTGAAGLVAARAAADSGASVALLEKAEQVGGTTALSSGVAWFPATSAAAREGVEESGEAGLAYLKSLSHSMIRPGMAQAFGSALGTKGGPLTTADGEVISGLYAAGKAMAAPTGMVYGGAGGTLGPALVFGYRAGRAAGSRGTRVEHRWLQGASA